MPEIPDEWCDYSKKIAREYRLEFNRRYPYLLESYGRGPYSEESFIMHIGRMLENQADELCNEGRIEEAISLFEKALEIYVHDRSLAQNLYFKKKADRSLLDIPQTRIELVCAKIKRLEP